MQVYSENLFVNYVSTCWCAFAYQHLDMNEARKIWMNVSLWKQVVYNCHCEEWGGIMEARLGLALIALSPAPLDINILSSTNLKKNGFVYSNVLRQ